MRVFIWFSGKWKLPEIWGNILSEDFICEFLYYTSKYVCTGNFSGKILPQISGNFHFPENQMNTLNEIKPIGFFDGLFAHLSIKVPAHLPLVQTISVCLHFFMEQNSLPEKGEIIGTGRPYINLNCAGRFSTEIV